MSAGDGAVLLIHPEAHVDAVRNALAVGDHQRRPVVGLRLAEGLQGLLWVGAHGDLRDVDVSVGDRLQREVLLRHRLACGGELGDRAQWRRLGHLAAGVRVHLGVEHQHVDVAPVANTWSSPPEPMSYAQPSPPTIHTLRRTRWSTTLSRSAVMAGSRSPRRSLSSATRSRWAANSDSRSCGAARIASTSSAPSVVAQFGRGVAGPAGRVRRWPTAGRARTPRCPRTGSSTRPDPARRRRWSTAWWAGCRRRSTSSRSRWRPSAGPRTAARAA